MNWIKLIIGVIFGWFILASIICYLILPDQKFETKILKTKKLKKVAKKLKGKTKDQTVRNIYNYIRKRYIGSRQKYKLFIVPRLFWHNADKLLDKKDIFLACHILNKIMITLLINTGQFKRKDIQRKHYVTYLLTIHQYLIVKAGRNQYKVDTFYGKFKKI